MNWKKILKNVWLVVSKFALKQLFKYIDKDKDGKLSDEEMKVFIKELESLFKSLKKK